MKENKFFRKETIIAIIIVTSMFVGFTLLGMPEPTNTVLLLTVFILAIAVKFVVSLVVIIEDKDGVVIPQSKNSFIKILKVLLKGYWFDLLLISLCLLVITIRLLIFSDYPAAFIFSIILIFMITKTVVEYRRGQI